jgi:hypothetical protein
VNRDVTYSFSTDRPYYLQSGVTLGSSYRLGRSWEIGGALGLHWLSYRVSAAPAGPSASPLSERNVVWQATVGYHLRSGVRTSVDARRAVRATPLEDRATANWQIGWSVSYGG